jgi:hypothetical protein
VKISLKVSGGEISLLKQGRSGCSTDFLVDPSNLYFYLYHPHKTILATLHRRITRNTRNKNINPMHNKGFFRSGFARNKTVQNPEQKSAKS